MHGFINSPVLAKLVALQLADEQASRPRRRRVKPTRAERRALRASAKTPKDVGSTPFARPAQTRTAQ
jgi:hypothetical protein